MRIIVLICFMTLFSQVVLLEDSSAQFNQTDNDSNTNDDTFEVKGAQGYTSEETKIPKSKKGVKFSDAYPEEINSKNYPNVIDTFDYPEIEIKDMVLVMAELTGKRFITGSDVKGKISIVSKDPITVAEAYKAFLSALRMNNLTIVPSGKFLKIIRENDAPKSPVETYTGEYFPDADQVITKILKLKYIPAGELDKALRALYSRAGDLKVYEPTNSLIITDYGSNVEKMVNIINELDVPGFEEKMEVIPIKFAKSKDIADLVNKIINKGESSSSSSVPRFRRSGSNDESSKGSVNLSYVTSDDRTNTIIVLGNKAGIGKAKELIKKLDFGLTGEEEGGVFVYYVKHNDAEEIAKTLGGIAEDSVKAQEEAAKATGGTSSRINTPSTVVTPKTAAQVFGGEVKIKADKNTNSLIITASAQDYRIVKTLLAKIDLARDQVFVETVIMEMNVDKTRDVGLDIVRIQPAGASSPTAPANGFAVQGILGNKDGLGAFIAQPESALGTLGGILTFGGGKDVSLNIAGRTVTVPTINGLLRLIQTTKLGNVLSTPKIMAMDNEESEIEIGQDIALGIDNQTNANGTTSATQRRKKVSMKLTITPSISPESEAVRLELAQTVQDVVTPGDINTAINDKALKTNIVVPNGDTAVLGGLTSTKTSNTITKVPLLGDIPILGWLFRSKTNNTNKTNLMLFITPKIIRNPAQNKSLVKEQLEKRLDFIKREMNGVDPFGGKVDEISKIKSPLQDGSDWDEDLPEELKEEPATESY